MKKFVSAILIIAILIATLFILSACGNKDSETKENTSETDAIDISLLSFSPKGTWVDLSDGQLMFEIYDNGTFNYGGDTLGNWKVLDKNLIQFSYEGIEYEIQLVEMEGHQIIGNENATFCLESDYESAHEDIYVPAVNNELN